jgi:guanine nucleotide-binding protein subunit alpha
MGACMSSQGEDYEQKKRSQEIDQQIKREAEKSGREVKLLLLGMITSGIAFKRVANIGVGSGESGKSTIVKQMKIIHQGGYTKDELALYRLTIYKNLIDCAKALIGAMQQFNVELRDPENERYCEYLIDYQVDPDPHTPLEPKVGTAVAALWKDPCMEQLMERQNEFYMMDSAP